MRIWVDMTGPAHVLVLRPLIERLRGRGHHVEVTSREYAQTQQLLTLHGIEHTAIGEHGGASRLRKVGRLVERTTAMRKFGRDRAFDLALAHGSNDLALAARSLGIPEANMHDYEFAVAQHHVGCRLARRVIFPESVPRERLRRFGVTDEKLWQYPGLKEEYYLADFEPDPAVLTELGLDAAEPIAVVRTPPAVSLYHRFENDVFGDVVERLRGGQTVVLPRTPQQRVALGDGFIVPDRAIDAQSLIAYADLVVSAGGTMNREAVALGTPVWTTFQGRLGAVDERLIANGRLKLLESADDVELVKRPAVARREQRVRRDPALLAELLTRPVRS